MKKKGKNFGGSWESDENQYYYAIDIIGYQQPNPNLHGNRLAGWPVLHPTQTGRLLELTSG